jgi:hypothetical protein
MIDSQEEAIAEETCKFVMHAFDVIEEMQFEKVFVAFGTQKQFLFVHSCFCIILLNETFAVLVARWC